jgi:hypothetical protein
MDDALDLAARQLGRMRGMTVEYHRRFFGDVRFAVVVIAGLFVAGFAFAEEAFLLVPVVALYTAVQTAFDASYLIFARQYATHLEAYLNDRAGERIHVGADMENAYLFPLDVRKVVTAAGGDGFSWFGFVTIFYTLTGVVAAVFGLALGWSTVLGDAGAAWQWGYFATLGLLSVAALVTGIWWFVGGVGEARLRAALSAFPSPTHLDQ